MSLIDPEGMFGGERMAMLSDRARWVWPWLWCGSNTYGRIELNYRGVVTTVFRQFKKLPTEDQFWSWVKEFRDCFLLFVYRYEGQLWGQWDCPDRCLPPHKRSSDQLTPEPNTRELQEWRSAYKTLKTQKTISKASAVLDLGDLTRSEWDGLGFSSWSKSADNTLNTSSLEDITSRIGTGERTLPSLGSRGGNGRARSWIDEQHDQFWAVYWNRKAKNASLMEFTRRIGLLKDSGMQPEDAAKFLIAKAAEYRKLWEPTEDWKWLQNLYASTWLHNERWTDDPPSAKVLPLKPKSAASTAERALAIMGDRLAHGERPV